MTLKINTDKFFSNMYDLFIKFQYLPGQVKKLMIYTGQENLETFSILLKELPTEWEL